MRSIRLGGTHQNGLTAKGVDNDVKNWPKVQIEVRERNGVASVRAENEWPIARTQYTKLYLNAANGLLQPAQVAQTASVSYGAAVPELAEAERATIERPFLLPNGVCRLNVLYPASTTARCAITLIRLAR